MRAAACALVFALVLAASGSAAGRGEACPADSGLGRVAYVRGGALHVLDLGTCADRTLVARGVRPPVRFSSSGRWIGFGSGAVVPTGGGTTLRPLGGPAGWNWSPTEDVLAGTTRVR